MKEIKHNSTELLPNSPLNMALLRTSGGLLSIR